MNVRRDRVGGENVRAASHPIGQNCRAVCTRKGGASAERSIERSALMRHERSVLAMATIRFAAAVFKILSLS